MKKCWGTLLYNLQYPSFPEVYQRNIGLDQMSALLWGQALWSLIRLKLHNHLSVLLPFSMLVFTYKIVWKIANVILMWWNLFFLFLDYVFFMVLKQGNGKGERGHCWTLMIKGKWIFTLNHLKIVIVFVSNWKSSRNAFQLCLMCI